MVGDGGVWECGGGRLGSRGGVEFEVGGEEEKETCPCTTPTMCRRGSRPGWPSRRVAVQGSRAVGFYVHEHSTDIFFLSFSETDTMLFLSDMESDIFF
jgi:hypothetical protein